MAINSILSAQVFQVLNESKNGAPPLTIRASCGFRMGSIHCKNNSLLYLAGF